MYLDLQVGVMHLFVAIVEELIRVNVGDPSPNYVISVGSQGTLPGNVQLVVVWLVLIHQWVRAVLQRMHQYQG